MYNTITAAGYLVSDPETRDVNSQKSLQTTSCVFLAIEQKNDEKLFIDVEMWGRQAEIADEYLKKGRSIIVNGELRELLGKGWEEVYKRLHYCSKFSVS